MNLVMRKPRGFQSSAFFYTYDADGNPPEISAFFQSGTRTTTATTLIRYDMGEQFDPDLGLYFLRARYMDNDRGRFWTMDAWEGSIRSPLSLHRYCYARSSPVSFVDPTGYWSLLEHMVAAAITGVTVTSLAGVLGMYHRMRGLGQGETYEHCYDRVFEHFEVAVAVTDFTGVYGSTAAATA